MAPTPAQDAGEGATQRRQPEADHVGRPEVGDHPASGEPGGEGARFRADQRPVAAAGQGPSGEPALTPSDASAVSDNSSAYSVSDTGLARIASIGGLIESSMPARTAVIPIPPGLLLQALRRGAGRQPRPGQVASLFRRRVPQCCIVAVRADCC